MLKTIVRVFGNAIVEAPNYHALIRAENWHRSRIAALKSQLARFSVAQNPRRSVEMREAVEQHEAAIRDIRSGKDVIEIAARALPGATVERAASVAVENDRVMSTDWRLAIGAVAEAIHA